MRTGHCKKHIIYGGMLAFAACLWSISGESAAAGTEKIPPTILMDGRILAANKQRILAGDKELLPAFTNLLNDAAAAMQVGPFSVMDKKMIPPSGDKHDYASYARYWWPDPAKPDGLPYIRRDGETNPDSQSPECSDYKQMESMTTGVEILGIAYFLTGDVRYAEKAAQLIRTWFLAPETRMNPNLNFSQGIPGKAAGTKAGIIDSRMLIRALEGALLISDSPALSPAELAALRVWVSEYLKWLRTNGLALSEAKTTNNHGTFYDLQVLYFALFSGDTEFAKQLAQTTLENRILAQVDPDGSMPEEISRTRGLHYSFFNLHAMLLLARLSDQVGVDLWHAGDSRIKAALNFLAPYADPARPWPYPDIEDTERIRFFQTLLYASVAYQDDSYKRMAEKLPLAEREVRRENLAAPLMR